MKILLLLLLLASGIACADECLDDFFWRLVRTNSTFDELTWESHPHFFNDLRLITFRQDNSERLMQHWRDNEPEYSFLRTYEKMHAHHGIIEKDASAKRLSYFVYINNYVAVDLYRILNFANATSIEKEKDGISKYFINLF